MVNVNIQGAIPLDGQGFVAKRHGDYKPGEFKRLTNVELHEGIIKNRRNIKNASASPVTNPFGFIGKMKDYVLMVSETKQYAVNQNSQVELWAPTQLTTPSEAGSFHRILSYHRYNNINYWLTLEFRAGIHIKVALYYGNSSVNNDVPSTYGSGYYASLTRVDILTLTPGANLDFNKFEFCNSFIQGDRLWVITSVGAYFSKPADFLTWNSPDGGFFKLPDRSINYGLALRDSIYLLCDDSVYLLTYSADPNLDSTMRKITDNMGGDHGCVYGDVPYFVNQIGIYRINNNFVEKVLDNEFDVGTDIYSNKLSAFEDYLVLLKSNPINYEKFDGVTSSVRTNLMTNPSMETNFTGYAAGTNYLDRIRSNDKAYIGTWSHKALKKDDNTQVDRTNVFPNPGSEINISGWVGFYINTSRTTTEHYAGTACLKAAIQSGGFSELSYMKSNAWTSNRKDHTIRVRFARKWLGTTNAGNNDLKFMFSYLDSGGNIIGTEQLGGILKGYGKDNWKIFEWEVVAPDGTLGFELYFVENGNLNPDNEVFFDSISVEDITSASGDTSDPYFDGDTTDAGGYIYDWVGTPGLSASTRKGNNPGPGSYAILEETTFIPITAGKSYTIGTAVYAEVNSYPLEILVRFYNAAGIALLDRTISAGPGDPVIDQWTYITSQFTADVTNATKVTFFIRSTVPLVKDDIFYFDALTVETSDTYNGYFDGDVPDTPNVDNAWTGTAHASTSTYTSVSVLRRLFKNGNAFFPGLGGNSLGYNLYFINMLTGAIHVVDFKDQRNFVDTSEQGFIVDLYVNTNKDSKGNYNCFFLTNKVTIDAADSYTTKSFTYYMNSYRDTDFYDYSVSNSDINTKYAPRVEVEIDSFAPDGNEYLMKKFRNLEVMGLFPKYKMWIKFGFDNLSYEDPTHPKYPANIVPIDGVTPPVGARPHHPFRLGVNQRARSISLYLCNELGSEPTELANNEIYGNVEISDIRTLWTYTGRAPTNKNVV